MKHLSVIAVVAALAITGCKKNEKQPTTPEEVATGPDTTATPPPAEDTAPPAAAPTLTDAEFEVLMGKAVAMFTAMGDAADKSGGDCGKLASAIEKVMADNQSFIDDTRRYKGNAEMERKGEEWMKVHQDQVMAPMMKVATAGQKCADNPEFKRVMEKLSEVGN